MATKRFPTNYKPRKKTCPPEAIPPADGWISRSEAIALIAKHCNPPHDPTRAFKNKVAGRIKYAVGRKQLAAVDGGFVFGDLMGWAKGKKAWREGLKAFPQRNIAHISGFLPSVFGQAQAHALPPTLEDCRQRIIELETQVAAMEARLEEQRPYANIGRKLKRPSK
jgi:hypothetical protein